MPRNNPNHTSELFPQPNPQLKLMLAFACLLAVSFGSLQSAVAQTTHSWDGGGVSTNFGHGLNWDTNLPPIAGDTARVHIDAFITLAQNENVASLLVWGNASGATADVAMLKNGNTLTVSGFAVVGAQFGVGPLNTQGFYNGILDVEDGGLNIADDLFLGARYPSGTLGYGQGTLTVSNCEVSVGDGLFFGSPDNSAPGGGRMTINDAGIVDTARAEIYQALTTPAVLLNSGGTWSNSGTVHVREGEVRVESGSVLTSGGLFVYGRQSLNGSSSNGLLTLNGGTINVASLRLLMGDTSYGNLNFNSGTIRVFGNILDTGDETNFQIKGASSGQSALLGLEDGATWNLPGAVQVAEENNGTLEIHNGSSVDVALQCLIGGNSGSTGTADIDDGSLTTNSLTVGDSGSGTLNLSNGGSVVVATAGTGCRIGNESGGIGEVNQIGGSFDRSTGALFLGFLAGASGNYNISDGQLDADGIIAGAGFGSGGHGGSGTVSQTGGVVNVTGESRFGAGTSGIGVYDISGGTLNLSSLTILGWNSGGSGVFLQTGGEVIAPGEIRLSNDSINTSAAYELSGGCLQVDSLTTGQGGHSFDFTGGRLIAGSVGFDLNQTGGVLAPGDSPGLTTINGTYMVAKGGEIEIELSGLVRESDYDAIDVSASAIINGTISVHHINGFQSQLGDSFIIVDAPAYSGTPTFDFTNANLAPGLEWSTSSFLTNGTISVVEAIVLGDVNLDGAVNLLDIEPFIALISTGDFQVEADCNEDGAVNLLDIEPLIALIGG